MKRRKIGSVSGHRGRTGGRGTGICLWRERVSERGAGGWLHLQAVEPCAIFAEQLGEEVVEAL